MLASHSRSGPPISYCFRFYHEDCDQDGPLHLSVMGQVNKQSIIKECDRHNGEAQVVRSALRQDVCSHPEHLGELSGKTDFLVEF